MRVDETTVRRIARLARIKISDEEAKGLDKLRLIVFPRRSSRYRDESGALRLWGLWAVPFSVD